MLPPPSLFLFFAFIFYGLGDSGALTPGQVPRPSNGIFEKRCPRHGCTLGALQEGGVGDYIGGFGSLSLYYKRFRRGEFTRTVSSYLLPIYFFSFSPPPPFSLLHGCIFYGFCFPDEGEWGL